MLDHLRQKASATISSITTVTLSTYGPASVQAGNFRCEAEGLYLYLLVPRTSELLFNIENQPEVIATAHEWQLKGKAVILAANAIQEIHLMELPEADWCEVIEIRPVCLHIQPADLAQPCETIDFPEINLE